MTVYARVILFRISGDLVNALFGEAELGCQIEQTFTSSIASADYCIPVRLFLGLIGLEG